ncbi:MAG: hypothetical protein U0800_07670 [Isosphaeraceae bacterium]
MALAGRLDADITVIWERPEPVARIERARLKAGLRSMLRIWAIGMALLGPLTLALIHHLDPESTGRPAIGLVIIAIGFPVLMLPYALIDLRANPRYTIDASGLARRSSGNATRHPWKHLIAYRIAPHPEAAGVKCLEFRARTAPGRQSWSFDPSTTPERDILDAIRRHRPDLDVGF